MSIREELERLEQQVLHPRAALSARSRGRPRPEPESALRTCFQRDRDRIIHSKAFRRLKHKTQVFLAPRGDHYRTRLTHVLECSQIARSICRALRLNEDLAEAIALGHDLGHTPFGHAGEEVLRELHPGGFEHYQQSLRVVDTLEKDGQGLNLTHEVRDGILKHSKGKGNILPQGPQEQALTLEGQVVRVSDTIAYLNHDLDDALRAGVVRPSEIPREVLKTLGERHSQRINTMVEDLVRETLKAQLQELRLSPQVLEAMLSLREFLYRRVYESESTKAEFRKAKKLLTDLYHYYLEHPQEAGGRGGEDITERHRLVCDFIAGMTDRFALATYQRLFLPSEWAVL
jgi:dGTPase